MGAPIFSVLTPLGAPIFTGGFTPSSLLSVPNRQVDFSCTLRSNGRTATLRKAPGESIEHLLLKARKLPQWHGTFDLVKPPWVNLVKPPWLIPLSPHTGTGLGAVSPALPNGCLRGRTTHALECRRRLPPVPPGHPRPACRGGWCSPAVVGRVRIGQRDQVE